MELVNYYFDLLAAEEIEIHPLGEEWEDHDLPILIKNSQLIQIKENDELTNVAHIDTLASLLWSAVENKEDYKKIKIGFVQTTNNKKIEEAKYQWIEYPTNILK